MSRIYMFSWCHSPMSGGQKETFTKNVFIFLGSRKYGSCHEAPRISEETSQVQVIISFRVSPATERYFLLMERNKHQHSQLKSHWITELCWTRVISSTDLEVGVVAGLVVVLVVGVQDVVTGLAVLSWREVPTVRPNLQNEQWMRTEICVASVTPSSLPILMHIFCSLTRERKESEEKVKVAFDCRLIESSW